MGDVRVLEVGPEHAPQVERLHREHYWRSHCLLLEGDFYGWQFAAPPEADGRDRSLVAVDDDGAVLSYLGVVPMTATHRGARLRAAHLISWLSPPAARGRGVGLALMTAASERYEFLFGRSVTPAALAIYRKLGFRYFHACARWLLVLDPAASEALAVEPDAQTARRLAARAVPSASLPRVALAPAAPAGAAALAAEALGDALAFERTAAYFRWRYERHPSLRYHFVTLGPGERPRGLAVVRIEDVRDRPARVLRVVEFLAAPGHGRALAEALCAVGLEHGCAYADTFGVSERFVAGIVAAGGFQASEEEAIRLPHLLQPWDADTTPPGLLFYGPARAAGRVTDDVTAIYVNKGDGNMDWPSWVPRAPTA